MNQSREDMLLTINNFLADKAESIVSTTDIEFNTNYVVLTNWINSSGEVTKLVLTGRTIIDGFSRRGTSQCIEHIQIVESLGNREFVVKFYKAIKDK